MGFIGLIRLLALLFAAWLLWRFMQRKRIDNGSKSNSKLDQSMVQCKQCGVHVPKSDAIRSKDNWYCTAEHQQEDND